MGEKAGRGDNKPFKSESLVDFNEAMDDMTRETIERATEM